MRSAGRLATMVLGSLLLALTATPSSAAVYEHKYAEIDAMQALNADNDIIVVKLSIHEILDGPACASDPQWSFAFHLDTHGGRATHATLQLAMAMGMSVKVTLNDYCNAVYTDMADLRTIRIMQ